MTGMRNIAALIAFAAGLVAGPAMPMEALSDSELDTVRGGYLNAAGLAFNFGVEMKTFVDGTLALASTLSLTSQGREITVSTNALPDAKPLSEAAVPGLAPGAIAGSGLVLSGNGGTSTLVQDLSGGSIRNFVINTADNRNILQTTAITIVMPNLAEVQRAMAMEQLRSSLDRALGGGVLDSAGR